MRKFLFLFLIIFFALAAHAHAATSTIDSVNKFAYGENIGWLNLGSSQGNVQVGDTALTGYIWTENVGWVSLNCANTSSCGSVNYGVTNDGSGNLSGYAWGENVGWISFSCANTSSCGSVNYGVTINQATGDFSGYAYGENAGWVSFNCTNTSSCGSVSYKVSLGNSSSSNSNNNQSTSTSSVGGGGGGDSGNGRNDEELPQPKPVFPSGRPPKFTPPASSQVIQIIQPGKSGEAVSKFVIPGQIAEKIKLIFELLGSTWKQGESSVGNWFGRVWGAFGSWFKPKHGTSPAVISPKSYGALDLYALVSQVREPELLPANVKKVPPTQLNPIPTVYIKQQVMGSEITPTEKAQIILQILKSIFRPTSSAPSATSAFPLPIPKTPPRPRAEFKVPTGADALDSLQGLVNMLQTGNH